MTEMVPDEYKDKIMILIIAEKPSLGRNIADAIGGMTPKSGYIEGNGYLVSWAFGHLFSLADVEDYSSAPQNDRRWTMDNLPCFPETFRFELRKGSDKKARWSQRSVVFRLSHARPRSGIPHRSPTASAPPAARWRSCPRGGRLFVPARPASPCCSLRP